MSRNLHDLNVFGVYYRNFGQNVRNFILEKETQTNNEPFFKNFWRNRRRFCQFSCDVELGVFLEFFFHVQHPFADRACHVCAQDKNIFPGVFQKKSSDFFCPAGISKPYICFAWPAVLWRRASCETWNKQFSHNFRVWTNIVLPCKIAAKSVFHFCVPKIFLIKTSVPNWGIIRYWLTTHTYLRISTHM